MQVPTDKIERVVASHWHSDHTGGLLSFLKYRNDEQAAGSLVVVDVHPDRPFARGMAPGPHYDKVKASLKRDPEIQAIKDLGAQVETHAEEHVVAGDTVYVSGEIPRVTAYEQGIVGGMRWIESENKWVAEQVGVS